ncbi:MAG: ATP-dependent DNA helicase RecG [Ignavibacteriae bacterium]|nr:ATP-dependent DNA helicase RecG [Ignavibacteria bacterium]MBI3363631.1 ATP-dependent DNA helicase RecG [Ignavibacteriota bacterium]
MTLTASTAKDLNLSIQYVKGIGPRRAEALAEHGISTVRDLLYYFPFDYIDLTRVEKIINLRREIDSGKWVTAIGKVRTFDLVGRPPKQRVVVILGDETGTIPLVFFRSIHFFKKYFSVGETLAVSGKVTSFSNRPQIVHPSIDRLSGSQDSDDDGGKDEFIHTKGIMPKYGSSGQMKDVNLHVKGLRKIMKVVVDEYVDAVEDPLPAKLGNREQLIHLTKALTWIHFPDTDEELSQARRRLKFDELFAMQLLMALRRTSIKEELPGISFNVQSALARTLVDSLPFKLTRAQIKVINEITEDLRSPKPMNRLLQGDVGSGKTIVALIAMLIAIDNGYQTAFMAPTEILAEQHFRTLSNFLKDIPINIRLLIGGQRSKLRQDILEDIRRGSANIIVGTHALIQEQVEYAKLGLVVIDEQHRFGVVQRVALKEKAGGAGTEVPYPDVLVMTATPIPRTLSLTVYGDLDVSIIDELPLHRKSIKTTVGRESDHERIYKFIHDQVREGRQVYIVYPLVEESEKLDLKAATESYEMLKSEVFSDLRVGLIHGRMSVDEKDKVMGSFKTGEIDILVATTVIEVGIDVPSATVMMIEHSERFGLSQLHQLRGRVGRGAEQSHCMLVAPDWIVSRLKRKITMQSVEGEEDEKLKAVRRLKTMVETVDGFKIAEIDLQLRGPGEFFGTKQSGLPELQIANLVTDGDILTLARREAFLIIEHDPHLRLPEHQPLRRYFSEKWREALALVQVG